MAYLGSGGLSLVVIGIGICIIHNSLLDEVLAIRFPLDLIDGVFENGRVVEQLATAGLERDNLFIQCSF